jgi:3'(2'), 5'-bisphosphate nucleotidase
VAAAWSELPTVASDRGLVLDAWVIETFQPWMASGGGAVSTGVTASGSGILTAGAVALPALSITYSTNPAPTAPPLIDRPPRIAVSRTRPAAEASKLADRIAGELIPMGSAGAKAMAVVTGEIDIYLHTGGQYQWDSAAPAAVAAAAGLHTSRADGSPLHYNAEDTSLPDLLICHNELAETVIEHVADILSASA